jgi:cyclopropane fatty-acyl-phospholipid synthase-like methyltransferase
LDSQTRTKISYNEKNSRAFDLHYFEEKLMVSPVKKLMLSYFEINIFKYLLRSIKVNIGNKRILEVGCGAGYGIIQINKNFAPLEYYAFDSSRKMVSKEA